MGRLKVTIPEAGKKITIPLTGRSVVIEASNLYEKPSDVPILLIPNSGGTYPIYPRNVYSGFDYPMFNKLEIEGTLASAGDEVELFTTDLCLPIVFNVNYNESYSFPLGVTFTKSANDSVQSLSELEIVNDDGLLPSAMYVLCSPLTGAEDGIKYAFGVNPAQGVETIGYSLRDNAEAEKKIVGIANILAFRFIAQTTGETPLLNFTMEY